MAQKSYSSSMFWARQIALAVVLVIVAGVMIYVQQRKENAPLPEGETKDKTISEGLSDFYREYRMSSTDPLKEEQGDFVLDIAGVELNDDFFARDCGAFTIRWCMGIRSRLGGEWIAGTGIDN